MDNLDIPNTNIDVENTSNLNNIQIEEEVNIDVTSINDASETELYLYIASFFEPTEEELDLDLITIAEPTKEDLNLEISSINDVSDKKFISENVETSDDVPSSTIEEGLTSTEEENTEITALVEVKPHSLLVAQTMFKKSINISIKSFLISLSLGFLNLFF